MLKVVLGKTGIEAHKNGFGALPVQRIGMEDAVSHLRKAGGSIRRSKGSDLSCNENHGSDG